MLKCVNKFVFQKYYLYLCNVRNKQLIKYLYIYENQF